LDLPLKNVKGRGGSSSGTPGKRETGDGRGEKIRNRKREGLGRYCSYITDVIVRSVPWGSLKQNKKVGVKSGKGSKATRSRTQGFKRGRKKRGKIKEKEGKSLDFTPRTRREVV